MVGALVAMGERIATDTARTLRKIVPGSGEANPEGSSAADTEPPPWARGEAPHSVRHDRLSVAEKSDRMGWLEGRLAEPVDYPEREQEIAEWKQLAAGVMAEGTRADLRAERARVGDDPMLAKWAGRLDARLARMDQVQSLVERNVGALRRDPNFKVAASLVANAHRLDGWAGVDQALRYLGTIDHPGRDDLQTTLMTELRQVPKLADLVVSEMKARKAFVSEGRYQTSFLRELWSDVKSGEARDNIGHFFVGVAKEARDTVKDAGRYLDDPIGAAREDVTGLIEFAGSVVDAVKDPEKAVDTFVRRLERASPKEIAEGSGRIAFGVAAERGVGGAAAKGAAGVTKAKRAAEAASEAAADKAAKPPRGERGADHDPKRPDEHGAEEAPGTERRPEEAAAGGDAARAGRNRPSLEQGPRAADAADVARADEAIEATLEAIDSIDRPDAKVRSDLHRVPAERGAAPRPTRVPDGSAAEWVPEETLSPDRLRGLGMPLENQSRIQRVADEEGVEIWARPGSEAGAAHLERGASPKPEEVKTKSDRGEVRFQKPEPPPSERPPGMTQEAHDAQWKAWREADAAFWESGRKMSELQKPAELQKGTRGETQIALGQQGAVNEVRAGKGPVPIAPDHDLWEITRDGRKVSDAEHDRIVKRMTGGEMGVRHGAHERWNVREGTPDAEIKAKISRDHLSGDKPLIRFAAGKEPTLVRARSRDGEPGADRGERARGDQRAEKKADREDRDTARRGEGPARPGDGPSKPGERPRPEGEREKPSGERRGEKPGSSPEGSRQSGERPAPSREGPQGGGSSGQGPAA